MKVHCQGCGQTVPAKTARERIVSWCLSMSGKGTCTSPQQIERTGEYLCPSCFNTRVYGTRPTPLAL
jgi:hypothetical protein